MIEAAAAHTGEVFVVFDRMGDVMQHHEPDARAQRARTLTLSRLLQ